MRYSRHLSATTAAVLVLAVSACTPAEQGVATSTPPTLPAFTSTGPSTSTAAPTNEAADYGALLLTAADLSDAEDTFIERSKQPPPGGVAGSSAFFVNEKDTRAISDTVLVYPDRATAQAALTQASDDLPDLTAGGTPQPAGVSDDSVLVRGTDPSGTKAVTVLLFTQDHALVRIRFESAAGDATTDRFVTSIGKMQQIALRIGLAESA